MPRTREDTIKTKIELSGEKAYKQACAQINAELRELSSEMKLLSSQYDDNADSTESLRKKQELYNRQLGEQQKKIDSAEKALKELEEAGNGSTEAARRMRIELNKNKTAYADTEKRVRKLADEIDDSESEYRQYVQAAKNVDDTLEELSSEMKLLTEKTKGSADSAETLRKKHDGLERVFKEQERKVSALEKAYAAAAKDGDRLGRESNDLKIALNNAKTAAAKTENELRDLEKDMDRAGDAADDAEDNFRDFGDAISGLGGPFGEAGNLLGDLADKFGAFGIDAGALLNPATMAAGGVAYALFEMGKYAVEVASETETAMAKYANQTGLAVEETERYKDLMQDLYTSGYGEDMEEISSAMARITQTTGELDPEKLGEMAKGALTLSDTFDIDMAESIRGANMLMHTFGVDGARAFDTIALAAQLGLNQNDNLLDSINEYAVHYQQLGLDMEDMFSSFENAQNAGVFDIDKVGDAIKEFGIRVREGDDDVREAFEDMGLNADDTVKAFNSGGEAAAGALTQVLDALFAIEDETLRNQLGIALFGTMWEDLSQTGIYAATNFNNSLSEAKGTLDSINNQNFDTLNGQLYILGRNIQTALEPLGMPISKTLTNYLKGLNNLFKPGETGEKTAPNFQQTTKTLWSIIRDAGGWDEIDRQKNQRIYDKALENGFEPFKVKIGFELDERSYAEQIGLFEGLESDYLFSFSEAQGKTTGEGFESGLGEIDTERLNYFGEFRGMALNDGTIRGLEEGRPDLESAAKKLAWAASDGIAQAYPGFEESGAWIIKGTETGVEEGASGLESRMSEFAESLPEAFRNQSQGMQEAGMSLNDNLTVGFEALEEQMKSRFQAVLDRVTSQLSATVHISAEVDTTVTGGGPKVSVTQNIYANETSYAEQQRLAKKALGNVVRGMM